VIDDGGYVDEPEVFEDFDAFWADHDKTAAPARCRIRGVMVTAPTDIPIALGFQYKRMSMDDTEGLKKLLERILGVGLVDELCNAGVGSREFEVLMAWVYANADGTPTTLAEAAELLADAKQQEAAEGKAPASRAARRR
jgi:hypothetical protein